MIINAVIFDLDGTLANSEPVYHQSEAWLAEQLNIKKHTSNSDFVGASAEQYMQWFRNKHQVDLSVQELCDLQSKIFLEKGVKKVRPFTATIDFLKSLHMNQIPLALASGSEPQVIAALIKHLRITQYFSSVLSSRQVGKSKPAPDVFLEAASRLLQEPQHCLVIEDSILGMQAAHIAGMRVVTINSQEQNSQEQEEPKRLQALQEADLFFPSMEDFNLMEVLGKFQIRKKAD